MPEANFYIDGNIPTKKNGKEIRINRKTGKRFPSKSNKFKSWEKYALTVITYQRNINKAIKIEKTKSVILEFSFENKRIKDLSNVAESVMDILVQCEVIQDDKWIVVPELILRGKLGERSKCNIKIVY